ncbi:CAM rad domain-containing protein [Cyclospora cayetanensis]|uniref:CAM rad domain-containing protein n=1 Tax=Cyclospora cayetanensis TaxID=88456 RepID=A0A1D3DAR9_9EIME|nr:CAM rad domain-containing protein [Cyclospora cayetanensis]
MELSGPLHRTPRHLSEAEPPRADDSCSPGGAPRTNLGCSGSTTPDRSSVNTVRLLTRHGQHGERSPFAFLLDNYRPFHEDATPSSGGQCHPRRNKKAPAMEDPTGSKSGSSEMHPPADAPATEGSSQHEQVSVSLSENGAAGTDRGSSGRHQQQQLQQAQDGERGMQRRTTNLDKRRLKDMRAQMKAIFKELARDSEGSLRPWSLGCLDRTALQEFVSNVPGLLGERLFQLFDSNGDDKISFDEFVGGLQAVYSPDTEMRMKFLFNLYDLDGNGVIERPELFAMLYNIPAHLWLRPPDGRAAPREPLAAWAPSEDTSALLPGSSWRMTDAEKIRRVHDIDFLGVAATVPELTAVRHCGPLSTELRC